MSENKAQKIPFKAEVKKLLDILINSIYTSREIFLRELISNASDALDKLRFELNRDTDILDRDLPPEIAISVDDKNNTITITDTGIGMTKEEVISNIGTIAKSGTTEFLKQLQETSDSANNIIGKFGVGFYSVFMVANEVTLVSRSYKPRAKAVGWHSDGIGDYEVETVEEEVKRGTTITIKLKDEAKEFASKDRLKDIVKRHSNFISFPIKVEDETVNTVSALWREPKTNIKKEQYDEFYKFLTYDNEEPADIIHVSVDAPIQFSALLFIPKRSFDFFGFNRENYGLDLYVRRVLIQHQNKDLLPEYLSFVKGVVDSEDLPLNISRETLQENVIFSKISSSVTGQVLSYLAKKAKDKPEEYEQFWKEHGKVFKLGYGDYANLEKFKELYRFNSSALDNANSIASFEEYVSRAKEDQKEIYYISGANRQAIELDPHLEIFKRKGLEVIYLTDPVDEIVMSSLRTFKDFELKSADQADTEKIDNFEDVAKDEKEAAEDLNKDDELHFSSLIEKIKNLLGDRVTDVRVSKRLTGSPSVLVNPDDAFSSSMQKIMRMANKDMTVPKKIFEINKDHKLIRNLLKVYKADENDEFIATVVEQLFETAQLQEGDLVDPHKLVQRSNDILMNSSDWYTSVKKL